MEMPVEVDVEASRVVACVRGEISLSNVAELRSRLHALLAVGARTVVVDVSRAEFTDASGAAALVALAHDAERVGVDLVVRRPAPHTRRLLRETGLDRLLTVGERDGEEERAATAR